MFLSKIGVEVKKATKNDIRSTGCQKGNVSHKYFYLLFNSVTQSFLLSHEAQIILQLAARKTHPRAYQCIWDNYIDRICNKISFYCFCQYRLFIDTCASKNVIVSKNVIFYLLDIWYAEAVIHTKYLFISYFFSFNE